MSRTKLLHRGSVVFVHHEDGKLIGIHLNARHGEITPTLSIEDQRRLLERAISDEVRWNTVSDEHYDATTKTLVRT